MRRPSGGSLSISPLALPLASPHGYCKVVNPASTEMHALPAGPNHAGPHRGGLRLLKRIFSRHTMNIVLLLLVVVLFPGEMLTAGHLFGDPDLWRHLADARILWTTHHFIHVEPYSFTEVGRPWTNPDWLAEMPFWMGYRFFGLMGIYIVTALAFCAVWKLRWKRFPRRLGIVIVVGHGRSTVLGYGRGT